MQYDLNQIEDPKRFQRLLNTILIARFGEDARLTPLRGADGGSDGETAPNNPNMEFKYTTDLPRSGNPLIKPPQPGRYLFQAKYHRTGEQRLSELRALVIQEFRKELKTSVLDRPDRKDVDYFFIVTNVPSSKQAIVAVDKIRRQLLRNRHQLHADIWWSERIIAFLDWLPEVWPTFSEIFPGGVPPLLSQTLAETDARRARTFRLAISDQHNRELTVKFRQIELEHNLFDLFVDLDVELRPHVDDQSGSFHVSAYNRRSGRDMVPETHNYIRLPSKALELLIDDTASIGRILLEGGPGQGKSTITQMAAQVYRERLLKYTNVSLRNPAWQQMSKPRFPVRIELRGFAEWLSGTTNGTMEQYIARMISQDSGGTSVAVEDIQAFVERSPVILLLDGLDEIGSDSLRDSVVDAVVETINRFEDGLKADLRVVLTTRPPALTGRRDKLDGFIRAVLTPMDSSRIDDYLNRWLSAQIESKDARSRIKNSFQSRRDDPHVEALARNPMQLSVLLQFIHLKGEAFPDRRAELYRDYFQIVIDRDVEKSPDLRNNRDLVESLHSFLGFHFHGATEINQAGRALKRRDIINLAGSWLESEEGLSNSLADSFFALGEERFGLIVAVSGEGDETTYGFEVQPIQEYFAASYISNRLANGNAHEIFELLVHRDYWREVALFLAGLRRPNEKADLVARAKAADNDVSIGWKQNGRAIILQLLREGVLHQPRHVLKEAIEFVADLLEISTLRVQRSPEALIEMLCQVGKLYVTETLSNRVACVVESYSNSCDEYALSIIHRVAAKLLPRNQYTRLLLDYSGTLPRCRSLVRMTCPYGSIEDLGKLTATPRYWTNVPVPIWARRFWQAALRHSLVIDVKYPAKMHSSLVVEFATDYPMEGEEGSAVIDIRGVRPPAIWKLQQNLQVMRRQAWVRREGTRDNHRPSTDSTIISEPFSPSRNVSYQGLSTVLKSCLRDLIATTDEVIYSLDHEGNPEIAEKIKLYVEAIEKHLKDPGISGWVACRCTIEFLWYMGPFVKQEVSFIESLEEFYHMEHIPSSYRRHFFRRIQPSIPFAVRLRHRAKPVPLHQIITDSLDGQLDLTKHNHCSWIADISLPTMIIKQLVEAYRSDLPQLLRFVGERTVVGFPHQPRLKVQDTQRILKICRGTDDQEVLRGAATIFMNASIIRIAEPKLIVKILSAAPSSQLVVRVFSTMREYSDESDVNIREKELSIVQTVAQMIIDNPQRYSFRIVMRPQLSWRRLKRLKIHHCLKSAQISHNPGHKKTLALHGALIPQATQRPWERERSCSRKSLDAKKENSTARKAVQDGF